MNSNIEEQYEIIFNRLDKKYNKQELTLEEVLGKQVLNFYDNYLSDINFIVNNVLKKDDHKNRVSYQKYFEYFTNLINNITSFDNANIDCIEVLLDAISKITKKDDVSYNLHVIAQLCYECYYE
jgi:hypothetical protein